MAQVTPAAMVAVQVQHLRMMTTLTLTGSLQLLVFSTAVAGRWMAQVTSAVMVADHGGIT
jgi:creatinine amidohydrolase/Fe(II)-dependent formamide hydrolase-like protein